MGWVFREELVIETGAFREERGKKGEKNEGNFGNGLKGLLKRGCKSRAEVDMEGRDEAMDNINE